MHSWIVPRVSSLLLASLSSLSCIIVWTLLLATVLITETSYLAHIGTHGPSICIWNIIVLNWSLFSFLLHLRLLPTWLIIKALYVIQLCICTSPKHTQRMRSLWPIFYIFFSIIYGHFSICHMNNFLIYTYLSFTLTFVSFELCVTLYGFLTLRLCCIYLPKLQKSSGTRKPMLYFYGMKNICIGNKETETVNKTR